jgi:hypothetical protein
VRRCNASRHHGVAPSPGLAAKRSMILAIAARASQSGLSLAILVAPGEASPSASRRGRYPVVTDPESSGALNPANPSTAFRVKACTA